MFSHWRSPFLLIFSVIICLAIVAQPQAATVPLQAHPLPATLAQWQPQNTDHYFDQVETPKVGALVWSQFPVQVYVDSPSNQQPQWREQVIQTVKEWGNYLPLEMVDDPEIADIQIWSRRPPLEPGNLRASSAETRYQVHVKALEAGQQMLSHQFIIWLSPTQTGKYIGAAARHELGHALGIWGHSPVETDVMYFSQVQEPPAISVRDVNTLKQIYQQPTRLGWPIAPESINFSPRRNTISRFRIKIP